MANTKIPVELSSTPGIVDGSNATAITINSSEQVGIGETSPENILHIKKNASGSSYTADGSDLVIIENNSSAAIDVRTPTGDSGAIQFSDTTRGRGAIIYYHSLDDMYFNVAGTSGAMVLNNSGNVGIGVTSPSAVGNYKVLQVRGGSTSNGGLIRLETSDGTSGVARLYAGSTSTVLESNSNTNLVFQTNATERMRIASGGGVAIGTTSPDGVSNLTVKSQNTTSGQEFVSLHHQATSGLVYFISFMTEASGIDRGYITYNNSTNTVGFTQASDEILKENIRDLTGGLDFIKQIKPRVFDWKEEGRGKDQVGFIAQEIETIKPEWVGKKEGLKNIPADLTGTVPYLIKAIQEQQELIDSLTTRIETLEATE